MSKSPWALSLSNNEEAILRTLWEKGEMGPLELVPLVGVSGKAIYMVLRRMLEKELVGVRRVEVEGVRGLPRALFRIMEKGTRLLAAAEFVRSGRMPRY